MTCPPMESPAMYVRDGAHHVGEVTGQVVRAQYAARTSYPFA